VTITRLRHSAAAAALVLILAACSGNTTQGGTNTTEGENTGSGQSASPAEADLPLSGDEFGPLCDALPGPAEDGSLDAMARAPVGTAVDGSSMLLLFAQALRTADLTGTLDGLSEATVFAPTNDAFGEIPKPQLDALMADKTRLREVLGHHVVPGRRVQSGTLAAAPLTPMRGPALEVTGDLDEFTVNGTARIVCGNVQTRNATLYLVDSVLMP
jgi:uncharacterized surface protein with fasciclin (FAS1) repeats